MTLSVTYLRNRLLDALQTRNDAHAAYERVYDQRESGAYWAWAVEHERVHQTVWLLAAARTDNMSYRDLLLGSLGSEDVLARVNDIRDILGNPPEGSPLELEIRTLGYYLSLRSAVRSEDVASEHQWFLDPEGSSVGVVRTRYERLRGQ